MASFEIGKIPHDLLEKLLTKVDIKDPRVVVGPQVGEDAAVLDMGAKYLVVTTDPITFTEERIGWYCVNVNANDIAVKGAVPLWFTATLLLPEKRADEDLVESIFQDIYETCQLLNITLCGGHTEITGGLERPILVGQMLGEVSKDQLVTLKRIRTGDRVLQTQSVAIEGTAILARDKEDVLLKKVDADWIDKAKKFLDHPGISVLKASSVACRVASLHGMHDPTEGGITTALWEMGQAGHCGLKIDGEAIPILPETQRFCEILGIDPLGLIASGTLLMVAAPDECEKIKSALFSEKIPCTDIGEIVPWEKGFTIYRKGSIHPLKPFERDELAKIF